MLFTNQTKIVCPKSKQINFKNQHKHQNALIKNIGVLLENSNAKHAKFWFCDNCTY